MDLRDRHYRYRKAYKNKQLMLPKLGWSSQQKRREADEFHLHFQSVSYGDKKGDDNIKVQEARGVPSVTEARGTTCIVPVAYVSVVNRLFEQSGRC